MTFEELLKKADKHCRTCKHLYIYHIENQKEAACWLGDSCKEFVPSDNLDYIEWLAEKRGLV